MRIDRRVLVRLATSDRLERLVKSLPGGEAGAWRAASRYVAGRDLAQALAAVTRLLDAGYGVSVDLFGERVLDPAAADEAVAGYVTLAQALPPPPADAWLSVDLSHLAVDTDPSAAAHRLARIAAVLPVGRRIQVGAEDAWRADRILSCVLDVADRGLADRLGATVQANMVRAAGDLDALMSANVHIRLVKGAYPQTSGGHPFGEATDVAFLRLGFGLTERGANWSMATHDARLREALLLARGPITVEQLLGVRSESLDELRARAVPTRVYVPYGPNWFRYWSRRVAESQSA